jgi:hypothetical protein
MSLAALRAVGLLVVLLIGGALALYMLTGDRRWLTWAWRIFAGALAIMLLVAALLAVQRLALAS